MNHTIATTVAPGATVYNPSAETYEAALVPAIFRAWGRELVDLVELRASERVLDVACGTGIVARLAAELVGPGGSVIGYDVNPEMLAVAEREAARHGDIIGWEQGDAIALPFGDASFDAVLCQQGAQFFSDRARGCAELYRVVTPRGRVAVSAWLDLDHHQVYRAYQDVLDHHLSVEVNEGSDAPFTLGPDELRGLLDGAGFGHVHIRTSIGSVRFRSAERMLSAIGGAHAPLAEAVAALPEATLTAMLADLTDAMAPYTDDDGIVYPMVTSIGLARP